MGVHSFPLTAAPEENLGRIPGCMTVLFTVFRDRSRVVVIGQQYGISNVDNLRMNELGYLIFNQLFGLLYIFPIGIQPNDGFRSCDIDVDNIVGSEFNEAPGVASVAIVPWLYIPVEKLDRPS